MRKTLPIYVPTYGRKRVLTYGNLSGSLKRRVVLVVHESEAEAYKKLCPLATVLIEPAQGKGAAAVKQAIYERCIRDGTNPCIILDDDLVFQAAVWEEGKKRFRKATGPAVEEAFQSLIARSLWPDVGFTTFSTPFFNDYEDEWVMNKRLAHSIFINVGNCLRVGASFAGIPTMSDIKFSLECYTAGLCTWTLTDVAVVDKSKPGVGGENADGRRAERFEISAEYLRERWPRYVRIRDASKNKRHKANIGCPIDIAFFPSRAFRDARRAACFG
jgi:hypothetical protein